MSMLRHPGGEAAPVAPARTPEDRDAGTAPGRRGFLKLGVGAAATAAATLAVGEAARRPASAAAPQTLPNLYRGWNSMEFSTIRDDEDDHVAYLLNALGSYARPRPTFKNLVQPNVVAFAQVAQAFENTGVGAYLGALPYIYSRDYLGAAGSIALIEARHAGYLNVLFNNVLTMNALGASPTREAPLTISQVINAISPFVASLNDPHNMYPLMFSTTPSQMNDIQILNFALALEYLERDFYDLNVPMYT